MDREKAEAIVEAVFRELRGRRGIGHMLREIEDDAEVYQEMKAACVEQALAAGGDRGGS